ncbi:MAG TPA: hypothetical protein VF868_11820 [Bacteroidia bacterium]|jgi:hypothetical protein
MELQNVNNISIDKYFWTQFKEYLVNFKFDGLPKGVHLTFSFNENSEYVNFHVSRNVTVPEGENKPAIEIFRIKKALLEEIAESLYVKFLNSYIEPFDISTLPEEANYFSLDNIESSPIYPNIEKRMLEIFKELSSFPSPSRLKIKGDMESKFMEFAQSEEMVEYLYNNLIPLPNLNQEEVISGMIVNGEETIPLMGIYGKWFKLKERTSLTEMVSSIVGRPLAEDLLLYTRKSIIWVKNAKTKSEVVKYNRGIELKMVRKNDVKQP